jgi:hypothetical protein
MLFKKRNQLVLFFDDLLQNVGVIKIDFDMGRYLGLSIMDKGIQRWWVDMPQKIKGAACLVGF